MKEKFCVKYLIAAAIAGILTRILLIMSPVTELGFSFVQWLEVFGLGLLNDLAWAVLALIPGYLIMWAMEKSRRERPVCFVVAFVYAFFLVFMVITDRVFWDEFGMRVSFNLSDYIEYKSESIGDLVEAYPLKLYLTIVFLSAVAISLLLAPRKKDCIKKHGRPLVLLGLAVLSYAWLHFDYRLLHNHNNFVTELQRNSRWTFMEALCSKQMNYKRLYAQMPQDEAEAAMAALRPHNPAGVPVKKNVVLVTMESMGADFLGRYGNPNDLTPCLDSLATKSLVFDNMYAVGNRSIRGIEAVSLCIPPRPGRSLVKLHREERFQSLAQVFDVYGYKSHFVYGGDATFDDMERFFLSYGYEVDDIDTFTPDQISFKNSWGTCDQDAFGKLLSVCDADFSSGTPFFCHLMTISNHQPYTYPGSTDKVRESAVRYSDRAIGEFLAEASDKPWFDQTVFVFVADHCALNWGTTSLPLDRFHIAGMIYAPGFVQPRAESKLCSQIDIMPTLFGLLDMKPAPSFYGRDVCAPDFRERAFVATFERMGLYADSVLTVLEPARKVNQYKVTEDGREVLMQGIDEAHLLEAQSYYQTVCR